MAAPLSPNVLVPIGVGALVLWRSYSRFRRMVGRQQLSNVRPWITVTLFPLLLSLLGVANFAKPMALPALGGGLAIGVCLGLYGLRLTKFERTPQGLFYTPSAHLGIALSLLLIGRVLYRMVIVSAISGQPAQPPTAQTMTPLTLLIFGTLAAYYVTYAIGLLRWKRGSSLDVDQRT